MLGKKLLQNRRGQSAIEYLMTYGWAIVIMGVVVIVLWQMNVFNPATTPPGCTGFSQVRPIDWRAVKSSNNISLSLRNDADTKMILTRVDVNITGRGCYTGGMSKEMRAGETYTLGVEGNGCVADWIPDARQYYRADITIYYKNIASDIEHRSVGECHGTVEP